jgi:hypothetical protein
MRVAETTREKKREGSGKAESRFSGSLPQT